MIFAFHTYHVESYLIEGLSLTLVEGEPPFGDELPDRPNRVVINTTAQHSGR